MAGVKGYAQTAAIATGTAKKTLLQVIAAANHRVLINEYSICFDGIVNTNAPILCQVIRQTTAGTMSSLTPVKANQDDDETLQTTAQHTSTVAPTDGDIVASLYVHPQGSFYWQASFGNELIINGGDRLALVVTAAVGVNAVARMSFEE